MHIGPDKAMAVQVIQVSNIAYNVDGAPLHDIIIQFSPGCIAHQRRSQQPASAVVGHAQVEPFTTEERTQCLVIHIHTQTVECVS